MPLLNTGRIMAAVGPFCRFGGRKEILQDLSILEDMGVPNGQLGWPTCKDADDNLFRL